MPKLSRCPKHAANLGGPAEARCHRPPFCLLGGHRPRHLCPRARSAARRGAHTFPSTRSAQVPGTRAPSSGFGGHRAWPWFGPTSAFGFQVWVLQVSLQSLPFGCQCTFNYLLDPHWEAAAGLCNGHPVLIERFSQLFQKYLKLVAERFLKDGAEVTGETESCSPLRDARPCA